MRLHRLCTTLSFHISVIFTIIASDASSQRTSLSLTSPYVIFWLRDFQPIDSTHSYQANKIEPILRSDSIYIAFSII